MRFILGPILIVIGFLLMKYSVWITYQSGKLDFAEQYITPTFGGTYTFYKLLGLAFMILAVLWMGGVLDFGTASIAMPQN